MAIDFTAKKSISMSMDDQITIGVIVGAIVATFFLVFLLTLPINIGAKKHKKRLKVIRSVNLSAINKMETEEKNLKKAKIEIDNELNELETMLSQKKEVSNLIDSFVETAEERNIVFDSLHPLPSKIIRLSDVEEKKEQGRKGKASLKKSKKEEDTKATFAETIMRMELTSSFSDFLIFMWKTERLDKTLRVKYLSVVSGEQRGMHKYSMIISVLKYLNEEQYD